MRRTQTEGGARARGAESADDGEQERGPEFVQSVARAFDVIRAFDRTHPALTIADVARRTGLTRAAARRFLLTLQQLGYIQGTNGEFRLSLRVLDLGYTVLSTIGLTDIAQPVMEEVAAKLHESCSVAVLDGVDIVYIARVPTKRIMSVNLAIGSRLSAYATSMGRVLLAYQPPDALDAFFRQVTFERLTARTVRDERTLRRILAEVRLRGWALVDQEVEDGVRSVAVPIRDRTGRVVAAINASAHSTRASVRTLRQKFLPVLLEAGQRISRAQGAPHRLA
jgi:IclR family transcriptional regulator, pca regulon regulatory protein